MITKIIKLRMLIKCSIECDTLLSKAMSNSKILKRVKFLKVLKFYNIFDFNKIVIKFYFNFPKV